MTEIMLSEMNTQSAKSLAKIITWVKLSIIIFTEVLVAAYVLSTYQNIYSFVLLILYILSKSHSLNKKIKEVNKVLE